MPPRLTLFRSLLTLAVLSCSGAPCVAAEGAGSGDHLVNERNDRIELARPHVDEVALRYYASLKQTARVEAETRRLRRLHPAWQPPADLWTFRAGGTDEVQLWKLFSADKLDELRATIAAYRAKDSNWTPSSDLEQKLRRKELRLSILANARTKRWSDVVSAASNWRSDIGAEDLEVLWLVAEGLARTGRSADALRVLATVLATNSGSSERIATIHKALSLLPMNEVERLLKQGRVDGAGRSEFDAIAVDIARARINAALRDESAREVSATDLARFQEFTQVAADPNQAALLGWYAMKRADPLQALEHFKFAIAKGGDATVALGLALALKKLGRLRDAEEVAYAWREPLAANMTLFIDIVADELTQRATVDPKRLTRYADVTLQATSGEGAQALGWYAYNSCQLEAASEWFRRAMSWLPKEPTALGYALTLQRLKRKREFIELVNRYDGLFPTVVELMFPGNQPASDDVCGGSPVRADATPEGGGGVSPILDRRALPPLRLSAAPRQGNWSSVPMPDRVESGSLNRMALNRADFPVAVDSENPYRSAIGGANARLKSPAAGWRPYDLVAPTTEARRVAGVAAMPYERFGRNLLPGWNKVQQASPSPSSMLRAPQGTQWAMEQAVADNPRRLAGGVAPPVDPMAGAAHATAANRFHP